MKKILALMIFAIGLMVSLPYPSTGCKAPPGQSSFITDYIDIAPAIAVVQNVAFVNQFNHITFVSVMIQEKGGYTVEKSLYTLLDAGYSNKDVIVNAPNFMLLLNYDFRLCLYDKVIINQSTSLKNIKSDYPVTIRADSQI